MNLRFWNPRKVRHGCYFKNFAVLDQKEQKKGALLYGEYGLKALDSGLLTYNQVESVRRSVNRLIKRVGKVWIRVRPETLLTKKAIGVRMGKGKGRSDKWVAKVKAGSVLFEVGGVKEVLALEALRSGSFKLPMRTRIVKYKL